MGKRLRKEELLSVLDWSVQDAQRLFAREHRGALPVGPHQHPSLVARPIAGTTWSRGHPDAPVTARALPRSLQRVPAAPDRVRPEP